MGLLILKDQAGKILATTLEQLQVQIDADWAHFTDRAGVSAAVEFLQFEAKLKKLFTAAIARCNMVARDAIYAAARQGNTDARGLWNGVIIEGEIRSPGASAIESLEASLRADWRQSLRTARRVMLRLDVAMAAGSNERDARITALRGFSTGMSDHFVELDSMGRRLQRADSAARTVCMAMLEAYSDTFFTELARKGQDRFVYVHPERGEQQMSYLRDWPAFSEGEFQPNARWHLTLPQEAA